MPLFFETRPEDQMLAEVQNNWPGWLVWYVREWDGTRERLVWCAKPLDTGKPIFNSPTSVGLQADLDEYTAPKGK